MNKVFYILKYELQISEYYYYIKFLYNINIYLSNVI